MVQRCFKQGCELDAQYFCLCLSSKIYCCEFHLENHLEVDNGAHAFDSLFVEPFDYTKDTILEFLVVEKTKKEKLKEIVLTSFDQNWSNTIEENLKQLESDLNEIADLIENISQTSEEGLVNNPLMPNNDTNAERMEIIMLIDLELCGRVKLFCSLNQLRNKRAEILNRANNDPETEQDFRNICSLYENQPLLSHAYQECNSAYQKVTSTYLFDKESNLYIYDTENEREEIKVGKFGKIFKNIRLKTSLPNGELFCVGGYKANNTAFIIDKNYQIQEVKSLISESILTAIYFNRSIYCFNRKWKQSNGMVLSQRFDLSKNIWLELANIHFEGNVLGWESIIFNGNILISNHDSGNLLSYSIDINTYSKIPYNFANKVRKVLINAENKLYLIECKEDGYIYESEAESEYVWTKIGYSIIPFDAGQVHCSYNKGGVYVSISDCEIREYFKFDLSKKSLIEIAYYSKLLAFKRLGNKLEAIECYGNTFKIDSNDLSYIKENDSIYKIGKKFDEIEILSEDVKRHSNTVAYNEHGKTLYNWGGKLEAIEYYDEAIKLKPDDTQGYFNKGDALCDLGRNLEAIECYSEMINLKPDDFKAYYLKGNNLYKLGRYLEAIECFNEAIKLEPNGYLVYFKKGEAFYCLGRYSEAIECYNEALKKYPHYYSYLNKGKTLCILGRYLEAVDSFNEAIRLEPDNTDAYNDKVKALRSLGRNAESIEYKNIIVKIQEANFYFSKGNYPEVIKFYNEQIKCKPDHADAYNSKGYALFKIGKHFEAIECYSMAIKLNPENSIYFANRANAFIQLGKITEAMKDFKKLRINAVDACIWLTSKGFS